MGPSGSGWGLGPEPELDHDRPIHAQRLSQGWPRAGQDCTGARPKLWRLGAAWGAVAQGQRGLDISRLGSAVPDPFLLMLSS